MKENLKSINVSNIINSSLMAQLIPKLAELGVLSGQDTYDIYDRALESLERMQSETKDTNLQSIYKEAREIIENPLRGEQRKTSD